MTTTATADRTRHMPAIGSRVRRLIDGAMGTVANHQPAVAHYPHDAIGVTMDHDGEVWSGWLAAWEPVTTTADAIRAVSAEHTRRSVTGHAGRAQAAYNAALADVLARFVEDGPLVREVSGQLAFDL
jgi:hypothetical protein